MCPVLRERWEHLNVILRRDKSVLVAFSGGCDSSLLLAAARRTLGKENVLAVTAVSASLAAREKEATQRLARFLDVAHQFLLTDELNNPQYAANPTNRCYFCKDELYGRLTPLARARGMVVADGYNASDRSERRPGSQAAQEYGVSHPLNEANLNKRDIRVLSRWLKLPTWNKPASPCLSSRIPFGTPVTPETLRRIERAEEILHAEGFRVVRVRHFGDTARIEVPAVDLSRLQQPDNWLRVKQGVLSVGYARVEADPRGYQSGRLSAEMIV